MKKITLLLIALSIFGCSKKDVSEEIPAPTIEGKWQFTKEGGIVSGQEVLTDYQHSAGCTKDFTEILTGGVLKDHYFNSSCTESVDTGTWVKNNTTLTLNYPGESPTNAEILELTATTLKVKIVTSGTIYISVLTRI